MNPMYIADFSIPSRFYKGVMLWLKNDENFEVSVVGMQKSIT